MTLVELFLFIAAGVGIYFLLKPIQRRLESYLIRAFKAKPRAPDSVIDITDYSKKDKK